MNSSELKNFSKWHPLQQSSLVAVPKKWGTYIFRKSGGGQIGRLNGSSDILYIGSTKNRRGLNQRMRQYLHPGPTQLTSLRINKFMKETPLEVAWCITDEPENMEHELLKRYSQEHNELPPLNHATKHLLKKQLEESVSIQDSVSTVLIKPDIDTVCRDEILDCARQLVKQKGQNRLTVKEIVNCMKGRRTVYKESTIRTHVVSKLCANAPRHHTPKYSDFERIGRGIYRLVSVAYDF